MSVLFLTAALAVGLMAGCGQEEENALRDLDVENYVTLCDYQNLSVEVEPVTISEEDQLFYVMDGYSRYATMENCGITDRAVANGDTINLAYEGKVDGEVFDNGSSSNAFLLVGSNSYIDGFEEGLVGVMPGETVVLNLQFPTKYSNPELAGKDVEFTVTVNYILELRDDVIASMGIENVNTVEEYKQYIYDTLYAKEEPGYLEDLKNAIMQKLLEQCVYKDLPEEILQSNIEYVSGIVNSAAEYGLDADTYTQSLYNMDSETYINEYAADLTKQDITMQAIANRENLTVGNRELKKTLQQYAKEEGYSTVEEYLGDTSIEDYRNYLMTEKVMDYLAEQVKVNN